MNGFTCRIPGGSLSRRWLEAIAALPLLAGTLASAATFTVTHTGDSGPGSLRWAIDQSNARPGVDRITFNIPGPGPHAIAVLSQLPDIHDTCDVDGATQPGYAGSPLVYISGENVDGDLLGYHPCGLIFRASDCLLRGVGFVAFGSGDRVDHMNESGIALRLHGSRNVVVGCQFGANPFVPQKPANAVGIGVYGTEHRIGDPTIPGSPNLISGNTVGIYVFPSATGTRIRGNRIGMTPDGTANARSVWTFWYYSIAQAYFYPANVNAGIWCWKDTGTQIGGSTPGDANAISGVECGIVLAGSRDATVQGNLIGFGPTGNPLPLANGIVQCTADTFSVYGSLFGAIDFRHPSRDSLIGGTIPAEGNIVGNCTQHGIWIEGFNNDSLDGWVQNVFVAGNRVGLSPTGAPAPIGGNGIFLREVHNAEVAFNTIANCNSAITVAGFSDRREYVSNAFLRSNRIEPTAGSAIRLERWHIDRPGPLVSAPYRRFLDAASGADLLDTDIGPNHYGNPPVVESVTALPGGRVRVEGRVRGEPFCQYQVEVFASLTASGGAARGEIPTGITPTVTTDGAGHAAFTLETTLVPARSWVTATATRLSGGGPLPATSTMSEAIVAPNSGRFAFTGGTLVTPEGTGITVTLRRTGSSLGTASVRVVVDPEASSARPLDYLITGLDPQGRIEFGPGISERTLVFFPTRDGIDELATELVALRLTEPSPGSTADNSLRLIGITDMDPTPTISVPSVSMFEANSGQTTMTFTAELSHPSERLTWFPPVFETVTADWDDIFGWWSSQLSDTQVRVEVYIKGDTIFEPDETFRLQFLALLTGPAGDDSIASPVVTGTIRNDDAPPKQSVFFTSGSAVVSEEDGEVWAFISRSDSAGQATVKVLSESRTATRDQDFEVPSESITIEFADGDPGPIAFRVGLIDDLLDEDGENFVLHLESPSWSKGEMGVGEVGAFIVRIKDNDKEPSVTIDADSWLEGNAGTATQNVTLALSAPSAREVQVQYASRHLSTDDADVTPVAGTVTFPPGTVKAVLPVSIHGDTTWEADETFAIDVVSTLYASASVPSRTFLIRNDDPDSPVLTFRADAPSVLESDGVLRLTVIRSGRLDVPAPFKLAFGPATTIQPGVEVTGAGSIEMPAGTTEMSVGLGLVDDDLDEEDELAEITLNPIAPTVISGPTAVRVTVIDDDAEPNLELRPFTIVETDQPGEIRVDAQVRLSRPSGRLVKASARLVGATATAGEDFVDDSFIIEFLPGETSATLPIRVLPDAAPEPTETAKIVWFGTTGTPMPSDSTPVTFEPLRILSARPEGGRFRITFPTGTYQPWRVERATDLKSTAWIDASGLQPGVGDVMLWEDPNPITAPQTFYRIRLD